MMNVVWNNIKQKIEEFIMHNDDNNIEFHEYFPTPTTITQNFIHIYFIFKYEYIEIYPC